VIEIVEGSSAARAGLVAGDRIRAVGGIQVENTLAARRVLAVASPASPLELSWETLSGERRSASIHGTVSPLMLTPTPDPVAASVRAAWAAVDAVSLPPLEARAALANLALLLTAHERYAASIEAWSKLRFADDRGVGSGTAAYHLAIALERAGRRDEALAALRSAADSRSCAFDDEGPPVAPAARDRLAAR
jgi:membrane-associated protease RseP (regulator of RpoE activity)